MEKNASSLPFLRRAEPSRDWISEGVLYAGMILDAARAERCSSSTFAFGDPETQAVLPLLGGDLAGLFMAAALEEEASRTPVVLPGASAVVVVASGGYPDLPSKGCR
ncbi:MAG: hypothetical protein MZU95_02835 [Desulfomicrobium escambiense]|nr:hypothetical protein [Desulfomicrobium escambiense]